MTTQAGKPKMPNLVVRVLTSVPLVAITLVAIWFGGYWFMAFCAVIGALVLYEWGTITAIRQNRLTRIAGFVCYAAIVAALFSYAPTGYIWLGALAGAVMLAVLSPRNAGWVAGGYLYATVFVITLSSLRGDFAMICGLFFIVWATDIGAYFCGRLVGGPKLAPRISPKKTWSGAIGGAFAPVLCFWVVVISGMAMNRGGMGWTVRDSVQVSVVFSLFILLLSVVSQLGDLGESWLKRHFNVKDSGNILPGHGGVMDRVDGLIAASALAYIFMIIM